MANDKIIGKIQKLMALGLGDPDSPESKSAMIKVALLMEQHGVASADLDEDGHIDVNKLMEIFVSVYSKTTDAWERILGTKCALVFDCKMITITMGRGSLPRRTFLGAESDVKLATYFYKYIRMQIMRRAEKTYKLIRDQKTYGYGCTVKVIERLEEMYAKRQEVMTSDSRALMVVKSGDVTKFANERYPSSRTQKPKACAGSYGAYQKGQNDGSKISINQQVGDTSPTGAAMIGG